VNRNSALKCGSGHALSTSKTTPHNFLFTTEKPSTGGQNWAEYCTVFYYFAQRNYSLKTCDEDWSGTAIAEKKPDRNEATGFCPR
jgi:hypothetical protein